MTAVQKRTPTWWSLTPLVFGAFVVASEGTILTGVLPQLGHDLRAEPGAVGAALALYPLVYVFGAPTLAVLAGGRSQRLVCTLGLGAFAVGNLVSASAGTLPALVAGRLIASLGACAYIPNAAARGLALGADRRGRVLSIVSSGFTAATLLGAPLGIYLASVLSWRLVLVLVAAGAVAVAGAQWSSRLGDHPVSGTGMRERLAFLTRRRLLAVLVLTFAVVLGEFVVYAYISLLVRHNVGATAAQTATAILVFGIGSTSGTLLGGFLVDRFGWRRVLWTSMTVIATALLLLPFATTPLLLGLCLLVWGLFGWTFTPAQTNRLLDTHPDNGAMLITLNASAVQLGVAGGGLLGAAVNSTFGVAALAPTGAVVVGAALTTAAVLTVVGEQRSPVR
ncbi:MFS transporter [Saccharothrix australiensis]|uniref:Putative MFS family arabinose efflux permease n=1 Tax=Saccharothrix australiensis TaxID=2072 RepID=A0A495VXZ8_9PSEU|nr:MFS transporter [Saccharothrix australiensis]RKT54196.1 putative MFS family arabinose efflux permease [Saccharothrix australiensis]